MNEFQIDYWYWWIFVCVFLILEALAPGVIFLWLAIAAGVLGVIMLFLPGLSLPVQLFILALIALSSALLSSFAAGRWRARHQDKDELLNNPARQYVGRVFTLSSPILDGRGKIPVDDTQWKITGPDCPAGTRVKVVGVDGILLKVEPLQEHGEFGVAG